MSIRQLLTSALRVIGTITARQTLVQDGVRLQGRAGGTTSLVCSLTCVALTANRTATFPDSDINVAGTNYAATWGALQTFDDIAITDAKTIALGTTVGTKLGTAVTQKLGFWNVTPIVQPAAVGQAAVAVQSQQTITNSTGGAVSTTFAAITAGATYAQADLTAVKNALASIAAQLAFIKTDVTNVKTHQDATRTALVNSGIMKGAA